VNWIRIWSGRASSLSRLKNEDLVESTLTTNGYMWTRSSIFCGSWLDLEAINSKPLGSLHHAICTTDHVDQHVQHAL
jgi:hypothetical protein